MAKHSHAEEMHIGVELDHALICFILAHGAQMPLVCGDNEEIGYGIA